MDSRRWRTDCRMLSKTALAKSYLGQEQEWVYLHADDSVRAAQNGLEIPEFYSQRHRTRRWTTPHQMRSIASLCRHGPSQHRPTTPGLHL